MTKPLASVIPFQPYWRVQQLKNEGHSSHSQEWVDHVLIPGLKFYLKAENPVIYVYDHASITFSDKHADIHVQLYDAEGKVHQPWLLTFVNDAGIKNSNAALERIGAGVKHKVIRIKDLDTLFPSEDIYWRCKRFTKEEILKAMQAWTKQVLPGFEPQYRYGLVNEDFEWIRDLVKGAREGWSEDIQGLAEKFEDSDLYVMEGETPACLEWLEKQGWPPVMFDEGKFAVLLPTDHLSLVQRKWCSVRFEPMFKF